MWGSKVQSWQCLLWLLFVWFLFWFVLAFASAGRNLGALGGWSVCLRGGLEWNRHYGKLERQRKQALDGTGSSFTSSWPLWEWKIFLMLSTCNSLRSCFGMIACVCSCTCVFNVGVGKERVRELWKKMVVKISMKWLRTRWGKVILQEENDLPSMSIHLKQSWKIQGNQVKDLN